MWIGCLILIFASNDICKVALTSRVTSHFCSSPLGCKQLQLFVQIKTQFIATQSLILPFSWSRGLWGKWWYFISCYLDNRLRDGSSGETKDWYIPAHLRHVFYCVIWGPWHMILMSFKSLLYSTVGGKKLNLSRGSHLLWNYFPAV